MYKLSSFPIEILHIIGEYLETEDLVILGRLNSWYSYYISPMLDKRIFKAVKNEGWRIHINILAKAYPTNQNNAVSPLSVELLLLSKYARINPFTLTLEFLLCPIEEDGLGLIENATKSERSIAFYEKIETGIDIVTHFAQVSTNKRLQHIDQANTATINVEKLWDVIHQVPKVYDKHQPGLVVMESGCKIYYSITTAHCKDFDEENITKLIDNFTKDYGKYNRNAEAADMISPEAGEPAVISFDKVLVSPEWWIKQMKVPIAQQEQLTDRLSLIN